MHGGVWVCSAVPAPRRQVCSAKCCLTGCETRVVFTLPQLLYNYRLEDKEEGQWWEVGKGKTNLEELQDQVLGTLTTSSPLQLVSRSSTWTSGQTCGNVGPPQGEEGVGDPSVTAIHPLPRTPTTCCPAFSRGRSLLPVGRVQGYSLAGSSCIKKVLGW